VGNERDADGSERRLEKPAKFCSGINANDTNRLHIKAKDASKDVEKLESLVTDRVS